MSSVAIMQPYFFPYLGYYQLIRAADRFVLYDDLNYIKNGWVNRNRLLTIGGDVFFVIVPVVGKSSFKKIRDLRVDGGHWRRKMLESVTRNYRRARHFEEIYTLVESVIHHPTDRLTILCRESVSKIADFLGISEGIVADADFPRLEAALTASTADELSRNFPHLHLCTPTPRVLRAIELCRLLGADTLINPIGGAELYPREEFRRNGVEVRFLAMGDVRYPQIPSATGRTTRFEPSLSILDVLMNCGGEGTRALLSEYALR